MTNSIEARDRTVSVLSWLIPVTYLLHIAEELWGGEGYIAYINRVRGVGMTTSRFVVAQVLGFALVMMAILIARRIGFPSMMMIILATTMMINGITHSVGAVSTMSYNPGLLSSILVWIPLGILVLVRFRQFVPLVRYITAIGIGVGINLVIAVITMRGGRLT